MWKLTSTSSPSNRVIVTSTPVSVLVSPGVQVIETITESVEVIITSPGPQGPPGPPGPAGGATFEQDFVNASTVLAVHGLGRYPGVVIIIDGIEVEADVTYNDINSVTVVFGTPYSGKLVCV